ncbi:MAG: radical SAM protein [Magnetococcales bacterium]|nr:radical SAM protein [Magnetococcales bacterium]
MAVETKDQIKAIVQPRIDSSKKVALEDAIPLATPFSAHIDVCSVCNFKCSFCFQADNAGMKAAKLKRGMMTLELFKKIVDDLVCFDDKLKKVKIGNHGEPTLHPDLPEMVAYLNSKNITDTIELFTNGSKLTPELNQKLIAAGLNRINISLEGLTSEMYRVVAGVELDMDEMLENMRHLYDVRGDCKIYIKIADQTSPLNQDDDTVFIMTEAEKELFYERYGNICDEIYVEKIVPQWARTQFDKQNKVGEAGMYGQEIKKNKAICPFIFMYLHFNWDGTTSPCTLDWPKKVIIGNTKTESVLDIWNGKSLNMLQHAQLEGHRDKIDFCNDCSAPMVCCNEDLDEHAAAISKRVKKMARNPICDQPLG